MKKLLSVLFVSALLLSGCGGNDKPKEDSEDKVITVGATEAPHAEILRVIEEDLKEDGYTLKVKVFDNYVLLNGAVDDGELDANYFQHEPYLLQENKDQNRDLVSVGKIHFEPLGIYNIDTEKQNPDFSIADVKEGARIAFPDDSTNGGRALQLLAARGIITLKEGVGLEATENDVVENPKNVELLPIQADGIPGALADVDYAVINGNYALANKITKHYIVGESLDSEAFKSFANILAVKKENKDSDKVQALYKALTSDKVKEYINDTYENTVVPAF